MIESFEPIVTKQCTRMILGTMPSNVSLSKKQYYGHPDNTFWDIIIRILDPTHQEDTVEHLSYDYRLSLLRKNKIALWDVLQYCNRKGSLDKAIRDEIKNDFQTFFDQYPQIKCIIFNGQKAENYFKNGFKSLIAAHGFVLKTLPSTSPTYATNTFEKLKIWRKELTFQSLTTDNILT